MILCLDVTCSAGDTQFLLSGQLVVSLPALFKGEAVGTEPVPAHYLSLLCTSDSEEIFSQCILSV